MPVTRPRIGHVVRQQVGEHRESVIVWPLAMSAVTTHAPGEVGAGGRLVLRVRNSVLVSAISSWGVSDALALQVLLLLLVWLRIEGSVAGLSSGSAP
jgi:hypothetical protein